MAPDTAKARKDLIEIRESENGFIIRKFKENMFQGSAPDTVVYVAETIDTLVKVVKALVRTENA